MPVPSLKINKRIFNVLSETFYFFGDNDVEEWKPMFDKYVEPPLKLPLHSPAISFGLGGQGTGVPFHFHGPGKKDTSIFLRINRSYLVFQEYQYNFHFYDHPMKKLNFF